MDDSFFGSVKVIERVKSPINGEIEVVRSFGFGTYIQVEGLTQSGGLINTIWRASLKRVKGERTMIENCLILGLGGGSVAGLVTKAWPDVKITGVDLDKKMVDLGKKYLGLSDDVKVEIEDAQEYVKKIRREGRKYDLILVDVYIGYDYPEKFESQEFVESVKKILTNNGIAVFNRLYFDEKRSQAVKFGNKLEGIFGNLKVVYPQANIMFICSK